MENHGSSGYTLWGTFDRVKPYLAVIFLQLGYAVMNIMTDIALNQGMSHYVLVVYRHVVATAVVSPFAIALDRNVRPKMTVSIFFKILALGLLEPVIDQNLYYMGMTYTSATFASAMSNVLPALTFIMAYILRLEKVNIKKVPGQAKVVGTVVTVAGAMAMTIYKGPILVRSRGGNHGGPPKSHVVHKDWVKGSLMLTSGCFCWAGFIILQAITLRTYPAEFSLTALICLAGAVEGTVVALAMEHGKSAIWSIGWNYKLLAAIFAGIVCSGVAYCVQGIIMKKRGPVFVTAFSPLSMIIVAILGHFILAEDVSLGRVLGAIIIVVGLYFVVWGKSKDDMISPPPMDELKTAVEPPTVTIDPRKTSPNGFVKIDVSTMEIETKDNVNH